MSELTRVPGPSSPLEGRSAKLVAVVVVGVLVAIIKPWAASSPAAAAWPTVPIPTAPVTASASAPLIANYDPKVFGMYEPEPDWELWPAGYLVSFGFAIRIDSVVTASEESASSPAPGASAGARPTPSSTPSRSRRPEVEEPVWPATISISSGSHLALLGINTPLGYSTASVMVSRVAADGSAVPVAIVRPPSPWPDHFTIIGIDDGNGRDPRESWPPGDYRMDLRVEPGMISRSIEILIDGPAPEGIGASPAPSPTLGR